MKPFCCCRIGNGGRGRSCELIGCGTHVCSFGQWMKQGCNWGNKTRCMGRGKFALGLVWGCDVSPQCAAGGKKRKRKRVKKKLLHPKSGARSAEVKWGKNSQGCDWKGEKLIWQLFLFALLMFPLRTKHPQHPSPPPRLSKLCNPPLHTPHYFITQSPNFHFWPFPNTHKLLPPCLCCSLLLQTSTSFVSNSHRASSSSFPSHRKLTASPPTRRLPRSPTPSWKSTLHHSSAHWPETKPFLPRKHPALKHFGSSVFSPGTRRGGQGGGVWGDGGVVLELNGDHVGVSSRPVNQKPADV